MTAQELIAELQKLPPNTVLYANDSEDGEYEISKVDNDLLKIAICYTGGSTGDSFIVTRAWFAEWGTNSHYPMYKIIDENPKVAFLS